MLRRRSAIRLSLVLTVAAAVTLASAGVAQAFNNAPGYSHFVSRASGKCLDVLTESTLPGFAIDQLTCRNAASQEWKLTAAAQITDHRTGSCLCTFTVYTIRNNNGENCATVPDGDVGNGTGVIQNTCVSGSYRQWWRIDPAEYGRAGNGQIVVVAYNLRNYGADRCLDVNNGSRSDELPMQIWDCVNNANQRWSIQ
jgi:hypothetical protein